MASDTKKTRRLTFSGIYVLAAVLTLYAVHTVLLRQPVPEPTPYSEFAQLLRQGKLAEVELRNDQIMARLKPETTDATPRMIVVERLPNVEHDTLMRELEAHDVTFSGKMEHTGFVQTLLLGWVLPIGIMFLLYSFLMRRVAAKGGPLSFGKNRARIYDVSSAQKITFEDVAGVHEAKGELMEVVDYLRHPEKYRVLGARIPKGVLLVGPPGTGKTLLARAVAGEAAVPFFSLSGSEFVEMLVGVGAARVRDLFEQAKQQAPCIVFIDELDAIGKSRSGVHAMATHDEREQTLNQLLVEMDGFDPNSSVIIMAATNRPEVLDRALLRAGRFDRQVLVDRPDLAGREQILRVHVRTTPLSDAVDLRAVAQRTPGMVGADLANVVNEAALAAARRGAHKLEQRDFEEAIDRLQLGLKKQGTLMNPDEKRRVAFHEAGHTLVALSVEHADPVHRVTIIPRSIGALGATLQLPTEERYLMTREELRDRIAVMMGGRAAEELFCDDISTGAQNDLERATETARQMVCRFGMSNRLGPLTFGRPGSSAFLNGGFGLAEERNFSEETARAIDEEVTAIMQEERERAIQILTERRDVMHKIAERLLAVETVERDELEALAGPMDPERSRGWRRSRVVAPPDTREDDSLGSRTHHVR